MKTLIGGAIGATLGVVFLFVFLDSVLDILKGTIPAILLLGGGLGLYLGFDELKDTWQKDEGVDVSEPEEDKDAEITKLKNEIEDLKKK